MLNLRVNIARINGRIKMKCNKHLLYNPEKTGQAGIRGGCLKCEEIYRVYQNFVNVQAALKTLDVHLNSYGKRYSRSTELVAPMNSAAEGQS